jgi:hypothetical protein
MRSDGPNPTDASNHLTDLLAVRETPRVSVVLPTVDHQQDRIRGRGLIADVKARAEERGIDAALTTPLITALEGLLEPTVPLPRTVGALALYAAPGFARVVALPRSWPASVHVGPEFFIIPVIEAADSAHCYALTLARTGNALWWVGRHRIERMETPGAPEAITEITQYREMEKQLQYHATARGGAVMFHGHQESADRELEPIRAYLRRVDDAVRVAVGADDSPILIIGPGKLPALYREVTMLGSVLSDPVESHPDGIDEDDIFDRTSPVVAKGVAARTHRLAEKVGALCPSRRASVLPDEILAAAIDGRVHTMLFDPDMADPRTANLAAVAVLGHGGKVVPAPELAGKMSAIFRY